MERLKILILAATCHPDYGSEQGVGWMWVKEISNHCDVHVICGEDRENRQAIDRELRLDPVFASRVKFHFLPWFYSHGKLQKFLMYWYQPYYYRHYRAWMNTAYTEAKALAAQHHFDVCHQLTMIGYREPGYLWKLGIPFVWGPVGGTQNVPWTFLFELGLEGGVKNGARNLINFFQFRWHPRVQQAIAKTDALISVAGDTKELFKAVHRKDSFVVSVSPTFCVPERNVRSLEKYPLRIVFAGKALISKNLPLLLNALATIDGRLDWQLDVIGDGPYLSRWQKLAEDLGISKRIAWHGNVKRVEVLVLMNDCHLFAFPSLKDASPGVVSEALSLGLPVICFDLPGQRDMVDSTCGFKIPAKSPKHSKQAFAKVIQHLFENPSVISRLSLGAYERAKLFTVDVQGKRIVDAYKMAIMSKSDSDA